MQTTTTPPIKACFQVTTAILMLLGHALATTAAEPTRELNVPPEGFAALFNGKDFAGWRVRPKAKEEPRTSAAARRCQEDRRALDAGGAMLR